MSQPNPVLTGKTGTMRWTVRLERYSSFQDARKHFAQIEYPMREEVLLETKRTKYGQRTEVYQTK